MNPPGASWGRSAPSKTFLPIPLPNPMLPSSGSWGNRRTAPAGKKYGGCQKIAKRHGRRQRARPFPVPAASACPIIPLAVDRPPTGSPKGRFLNSTGLFFLRFVVCLEFLTDWRTCKIYIIKRLCLYLGRGDAQTPCSGRASDMALRTWRDLFPSSRKGRKPGALRLRGRREGV